MKSHLLSLFNLFFPAKCQVCGGLLDDGEDFICVDCRWDMPLTRFSAYRDNPMRDRLRDFCAVDNATALYFYAKQSNYARVIHNIKYRGNKRSAYLLGRWLGEELAESGLYDDIDMVVPVPLHPFRYFRRGYNQAEYIARGVCEVLHCPLSKGNLIRSSYNQSQTRHSANERWDNVSGIFTVLFPSKFEGKHILIVDDVLTTGATIVACDEALRAKVADFRLSISTIATSSSDSFGR